MQDLNTLLSTPIEWSLATKDVGVNTFLNDLQANILKGHGRHHTVNIFLSFAGMAPEDVARAIRALSGYCTSAYSQLRMNKKYPPYIDGGSVRCMFLSASGYQALGEYASMPGDAAFQAGMEARGTVLADPPRSAWNAVGWRDHRPDAMFLIANANPAVVDAELMAVEAALNGTGVRITVIERGLQQTREFRPGHPEGVEHFGYVDGRSQPLFLKQDVIDEQIPDDPAGTPPGDKQHWNPAFPPSQFIVHDPNGVSALSCGSYFVFRKLEQDVRGFNAAEDELGTAIFGASPTQDEKDRAGAMVVGRFEDGTPLTLGDRESKAVVTNDFTYAKDEDGLKCPFHAHIRKVNPRGDIERVAGIPDEAPGRIRIMARRGITYGKQRPLSADKADFADAGHEPTKDVGLLFMAYMADVAEQFEFTQQSWANTPQFAGNIGGVKRAVTGIDPVIGQVAPPATADKFGHTFQDGWSGSTTTVAFSFSQFVHMQGGEYFFAPSLSFLRGVGA